MIKSLALITEKNYFQSIIKRYAEIASPFLVPLSKVQCCFTNIDDTRFWVFIKILWRFKVKESMYFVDQKC